MIALTTTSHMHLRMTGKMVGALFKKKKMKIEESSEDMSHEEDDLFSDDDYDGFEFIQDVVSCKINGKAGNS